MSIYYCKLVTAVNVFRFSCSASIILYSCTNAQLMVMRAQLLWSLHIGDSKSRVNKALIQSLYL